MAMGKYELNSWLYEKSEKTGICSEKAWVVSISLCQMQSKVRKEAALSAVDEQRHNKEATEAENALNIADMAQHEAAVSPWTPLQDTTDCGHWYPAWSLVIGGLCVIHHIAFAQKWAPIWRLLIQPIGTGWCRL